MSSRGLVERIVRTRRARAADDGSSGGSDDASSREPDRLEGLQERIAHLESSLEALQDAMLRESSRHDEEIAELRSQLDPRSLSRALSEDARRRGL